MKFLIFSQSGNETLLSDGICVGERNPRQTIGDELKKVLEEKKLTTDFLISKLGTSYVDTIKRVLNNEEVPKPKFVRMVCGALELETDYFEDKELRNVLITEKGIIVAKYHTNERTLEVKQNLDKEIEDLIRSSTKDITTIIIHFPEE